MGKPERQKAVTNHTHPERLVYGSKLEEMHRELDMAGLKPQHLDAVLSRQGEILWPRQHEKAKEICNKYGIRVGAVENGEVDTAKAVLGGRMLTPHQERLLKEARRVDNERAQRENGVGSGSVHRRDVPRGNEGARGG